MYTYRDNKKTKPQKVCYWVYSNTFLILTNHLDTVKESSMQTPLDADAVACFIRYELSLNVEAQERFAQWGRNSNKNPPTYAPK